MSTATTSAATGISVTNVPLVGFTVGSDAHKTGRFRDETEQERNRYAAENGIPPWEVPMCRRRHNGEDRGLCTRVRGHMGMHFAGDGDCIVGAW